MLAGIKRGEKHVLWLGLLSLIPSLSWSAPVLEDSVQAGTVLLAALMDSYLSSSLSTSSQVKHLKYCDDGHGSETVEEESVSTSCSGCTAHPKNC